MSGVGGVEPETVTFGSDAGLLWREIASGDAPLWQRTLTFPTLSALRLVEEELRQAREERDDWKEHAGANDQDREDESQLRAEAEANWQRESALLRRAEADRDRLAEALSLAEGLATERLVQRDEAREATGRANDRTRLTAIERDRAEADRDRLAEAIRRHSRVQAATEDKAEWYANDQALYDDLAAVTASPVQGEREQDGEPVWKNVPPLEDFMTRIGMPLDKKAQDGDTEAHPPCDVCGGEGCVDCDGTGRLANWDGDTEETT